VTAGQAETYLRLRAEAELRRALTLPRFDPPGAAGLPGPLRAAVDLTRPGAALIASAARPALPLARRAAGALQPLGDAAAHRLLPLAEEAARRAQPIADGAVRRLQPIAADAVRKVQPLGWRAVEALQTLGAEAAGAALSLRRQGGRAISFLPGDRSGIAGRRELSAEEGVQRLRVVASALVQADAIDSGTADSVLDGLETALLARSRISPHWLWRRDMLAGRRRHPAVAPAGRYLAVPVGVTLPAAPDSGLGDTSLLTLVIAPDLASLTALGHRPEQPGQAPPRDHWEALHDPGVSWPTAADDRGTSYQFRLGSWSSESGRSWTGTLDMSPVPAAGIRWLDLTVSPGSAPIRVDLTGVSRDGDGAAGPVPEGSPVGRLFEVAAENMLEYAARNDDNAGHYQDLSGIADIATALAACGALPPACAALDRLTALARHLGVDVPAVLSASAQPAELPDAWTSVLANGHPRDSPHGVAAAAAVLPELGGARFVLAGLRSDADGTELRVLGWGRRVEPHPFGRDTDSPWSWWARDDAGRWHMLRMDSGGGSSDGHSDMQMRLFPPLHREATSLQVTLTGSSGRVTVTMPLHWLAQA
jgi:hypothetical protein